MNKIIFNSFNQVRLIWRVLLFTLLIFLINIPLQLGLQEILDKSLLRGYVSGSIFLLSVLSSLYVHSKYVEKSSFREYGLSIDRKWVNEFLVGCFIAGVQLSLFFLVMYFTGNLEIVDYMTTSSTDFSFAAGFLSEMFSQLVGSTAEEIFHRSFLFFIIFEALRFVNKSPIKRAIIACLLISPLFGLGHLTNNGATLLSTINLSLDGLMISLPFIITGRLGMSIGLHFSWNILQGAVFGFANSGYIAKVSLMNTTMPDNLLTGGDFGPEGSILLVFLNVVAVILIVFWKNFKKYDHWVSPSIIKIGSNNLQKAG